MSFFAQEPDDDIVKVSAVPERHLDTLILFEDLLEISANFLLLQYFFQLCAFFEVLHQKNTVFIPVRQRTVAPHIDGELISNVISPALKAFWSHPVGRSCGDIKIVLFDRERFRKGLEDKLSTHSFVDF